MANIMHGYLEAPTAPRVDERVEHRGRDLNYGRMPNQHGYGTDLPCGLQVLWEGRWRNAYVMRYGNGAGSPYIKTAKGPDGRLYLSDYD